jgi:predicted metal-dependent phosphoesterase TrpH
LIDEAKMLKYDVLAITAHTKVIFSEQLKKYAEEKEIFLIQSIEMRIGRRDILCININEKIEKIKTFKELREYKRMHPHCLIIAPHPYFPGPSLFGKLKKNIDIFDAIENSFFYTKFINFNRFARTTAKRYNKPIVATSDCHILKYLDIGYTEIDSEKSISSIFSAIKQNKIKISTSPLSIFKMIKIFFEMLLI